ncbi:MAG: hypothetical protein LBI14_06580 [Treponema sp.]|jgi:putative aldouronate transport system substrate-binding protein|nr:hypothetical protein [Treponema sp.]
MSGIKKTAIFILAAFVLVMAFSGCQGRTGGSSGGGDFTFTGYPMNAKDTTISWWIGEGYRPNAIYADAKDSPFHSGLAEMLGVNIEWVVPIAGTDQTQARNLILASGDIPDVMFGGGLMAEAERYIDERTFIDLSPHIQEWSPAFYAWIHTDPAYDRAMKTDSGRYYGYGFFREDGGWNDTYLGPVVNQAWLRETGLRTPETIADWDTTLRTFKQRYGALLSFAWSRVTGYGTGISGSFGAYSFADYKLYVDNNNRIQLANIQPEYLAQLRKFNEWWNEGLIDQNVLTINDTMARSNAQNKIMGLSITSMGQMSNWRLDAEAAGNGADWVGLQYPRGNDGTLVQVPGGYGIGSVVAAITTSVKDDRKLQIIMRAMDYAYTTAGNLYWNYGKQGVSWDYDSSGKPMYLPLVTQDPNGLNDAIDKYGGSTWSGNCIQETLLLYLKNTQASIDANDLWFYPNQAISAKHTIPNGLTRTVEEATRAAELQTAITTYVNESVIQFITGQIPFSQWDAFVQRVNQMGIAELLRIQQGAYDRYLRR